MFTLLWKDKGILMQKNSFLGSRIVCVHVKLLSRVRLFATLWTVARQAPLSMGFSRQEYWSGLPFPPPGDLPNPGIEPGSPALQADALSSEPSRGEGYIYIPLKNWNQISLTPRVPKGILQSHLRKVNLTRFTEWKRKHSGLVPIVSLCHPDHCQGTTSVSPVHG